MQYLRSIFLMFFCFFTFSSCDNRISSSPFVASSNAKQPTQEAWGIDFTVMQKEQKLLRVKAAYMARYEHPTTPDSTYSEITGDSTNKRVYVEIFDTQGKPSATVELDRLIYKENSLFFTAKGNVLVNTTSKRKLESNEISWDNTKRELRAPKQVKITTPTEQFVGTNLITDEQLQNLSIQNLSGQAYINN